MYWFILYATISMVFFLYFTIKVSPYLSNSIPMFNKLQENHKLEWHTRNSSTVHAATVTLIAIYILMFDENVRNDLVWGESKIAEINISITLGYLIADLYIMITKYDQVGGSVGMIVHHASSAYAYIYSLSAGVLYSVANFRLLAELSTPFVNLRWCLSITGDKKSNLYFWNGVVMTASFFISRILTMPYFYIMVPYITQLESYSSVSTPIHVSWIGTCMVLDILNINWFWKMFSGMYKHIMRSRRAVASQEARTLSSGATPIKSD